MYSFTDVNIIQLPWQPTLHRHPLVVSSVLRARQFKDIIFVTDAVMEPKTGATVNYISRKCRYQVNYIAGLVVGGLGAIKRGGGGQGGSYKVTSKGTSLNKILGVK